MKTNILKEGSIFDVPCTILVNPVNCVGVMGGGLALEFKKRYPNMYKIYQEDCKYNNIAIGKCSMFIVDNNLTIINFPTKLHWKNPSKYYYIAFGLRSLHSMLAEGDIVNIPALGCGLGGLKFEIVKELVEEVEWPNATINLFAPKE